MSKEIRKKLGVHPNILWLEKMVHGKKDILCGICKKDKFPSSKMTSQEKKYLFYTRHKKYLFSQYFCANIECPDPHPKFISIL